MTMISKLKDVLNRSKDKIKDARNKMITDPKHDKYGWYRISLDDYDSLIREYECTVEHLKQIIKGDE